MLVAAFCAWHEHHEPAAGALEAMARQRRRLVLAAPVLLEAYAVLTRLPAPHRLSLDSARELLRGNLAARRAVALDTRGYWRLIDRAADGGVAGGRSYDALVVACAVRAGVDRLLTLNRRDFEALVPDSIAVECPVD